MFKRYNLWGCVEVFCREVLETDQLTGVSTVWALFFIAKLRQSCRERSQGCALNF